MCPVASWQGTLMNHVLWCSDLWVGYLYGVIPSYISSSTLIVRRPYTIGQEIHWVLDTTAEKYFWFVTFLCLSEEICAWKVKFLALLMKKPIMFICVLDVRINTIVVWKRHRWRKNKRPPGLIAPLLRNPPKNTTKGRDLLFNEGIRLLNMADTSLDRFTWYEMIQIS